MKKYWKASISKKETFYKILDKNYILMFIAFSLIRLLFFQNKFIGLRDFDCIPRPPISLTGSFIITRPLSLKINYFLISILEMDLWSAKLNIGCITIIASLLLFNKILQKTSLNVYGKIFCCFLFTQNPCFITFSDSLGAYFWMLIFFLGCIYCFDEFFNEKLFSIKYLSLLCFILLLSFSHFISNAFFIAFLPFLFSFYFIKNRNKFLKLLITTLIALPFLINNYHVFQRDVEKWALWIKKEQALSLLSSDGLYNGLITIGVKILNVLPALLSGYTIDNFLLLIIMNSVLVFLCYKAIKLINLKEFYYAAYSFIIFITLMLVARIHAFLDSNLYPQSMTIYFIFIVPILLILLVYIISHSFPKYKNHLLCFISLLSLLNSDLRKEGFDYYEYEESLTEITSDIMIYHTPSFIISTYDHFLRHSIITRVQDLKNNISQLSGPTIIDVIKYKEFGLPIYNYDSEIKRTIKLINSLNKKYHTIEYDTYTRFFLK
ncbi:MAG: hypothetical protein HQK51_06765 [Oligoflexia bacterium]|nr:hypothetical protein [Oligoflexia bacterium]